MHFPVADRWATQNLDNLIAEGARLRTVGRDKGYEADSAPTKVFAYRHAEESSRNFYAASKTYEKAAEAALLLGLGKEAAELQETADKCAQSGYAILKGRL